MTRHRGSQPAAVTLDEVYPQRRKIGPLRIRFSRKARRASRHQEVAAIGADLRTQTYQLQNQAWGAQGTGPDGLTPRQRRRVRHKANSGR